MAIEDTMARPLVHETRHAQHLPSDITLWLFCIYHTQNGLLLSCSLQSDCLSDRWLVMLWTGELEDSLTCIRL